MRRLTMFYAHKKPQWAALCTAVYTDRKGRKYYKYSDEMNMCIMRKGDIDKCMMELRYGSDYRDVMNGIITLMRKSDKKGNMTPDITGVSYLAQEILDRDKMLLLPEIMMKICANTLIREDENPYIVDEEILEQKLATFKAEIQRGGLFDFFHTTGLLELIAPSITSTAALSRNMTDSEIRAQKHQRTATFILSGRSPIS